MCYQILTDGTVCAILVRWSCSTPLRKLSVFSELKAVCVLSLPAHYHHTSENVGADLCSGACCRSHWAAAALLSIFASSADPQAHLPIQRNREYMQNVIWIGLTGANTQWRRYEMVTLLQKQTMNKAAASVISSESSSERSTEAKTRRLLCDIVIWSPD